MAEDLHDELDAFARDVERAILEFDDAIDRHSQVRQRAHTPVFRSGPGEVEDVQDLFF
ncbi:hypothetical protein ACFQJC_05150 [Haloferax namakaokahaiae]|uniref:Uncharacterized protein n=1 Tax=Haloferax namakaokahaiae TaxID=1748331 RepID=A0ABD5ZCH7_9EURY